MAKFKNQDILLDDNEQIIFGSSQDAAMYWDTSDLITSKHLKHLTEGYYATKDYVKGVVAGLEWQDSVISATTDIPGVPVYGDRYIVPSGASGAWSGLDDDIAEYTTSWSYVTPSAGFSTWVNDISAWYVYDGSNWINFSGKIDHGTLKGLADDDHTQYIRHALATAANDFLVASGSGTFVKKTLAETGAILETDLDHGSIQGLDGDDHAQYHNDTRGDARYYTQALLDGGQLDNRYYTEAETLTLTKEASANAANYTDFSITDHEAAVDPHTGYLLADGSRDITGTQTISGGDLIIATGSGIEPYIYMICDAGENDSDYWRLRVKDGGTGLAIQCRYTGDWETGTLFDPNGGLTTKTLTVTGNTNIQNGLLNVYGIEGGPGYIYLSSDQGDDNMDKWLLKVDNVTNDFTLESYGTGSWVPLFTMDTSGGAILQDLTIDTMTVGTSAGATGWFDDGANFRVKVAEGIITNIGASVGAGYYME